MADLAGALQHIWAEHGIDVDIDIAPSAIDAERVATQPSAHFPKVLAGGLPRRGEFHGPVYA